MKRLKQSAALLLLLALLCALLPQTAWAAGGEGGTATVLFTHDLHSSFLPRRVEGGGQSGGYARLAYVLARERADHPNALTLDGGDFSMGSLIQTLYTTRAPELRTMGAMGYDAVTAGNHDFDHTGRGFGEMLTAARRSGDPLPALVLANYKPGEDDPDRLDIQRAMSAYGAREYMLLERGGVTYGVFGLMGRDAHDSAPVSGFALEDPVQAARRCVDSLEEQGAQFIICLSHCGTDDTSSSEDQRLAREVEGIDLIVSGHSHTTLVQPILENGTYIVSAGSNGENLGSVTLSWDAAGEKSLEDYRLIPIDGSVPEDGAIAALVQGWRDQVDSGYLAGTGLTYDRALTASAFDLSLPQAGERGGNALGELAADAFRWAVEQAEGENYIPVSVALVPEGTLRAPLAAGPITTAQAFDVLSLGVGADGTDGYPLVSCWLTGRELEALAEVDASVAPLMPAARLYLSGVNYSFNVHRAPFDRVTRLTLDTGERPDRDGLYRVVGSLYSAQMLGVVGERSLGLLSIVPKDESGQPIQDFTRHILRRSGGGELKEWYALASYLQSFSSGGLPADHAQPDGRKTVSHSWNPLELVKSPGWPTLLALAAAALAVWLVVFLVRRFLLGVGGSRRGGGYRRRRLF